MEREVLKIEDKSRIESITFMYPNLMSNNAETLVKEVFNKIKEKEREIQNLRQQQRGLEEELNKLRDTWNNMSKWFTYTHPVKEKDYIIDKCSIIVKGHGNDIIGKTTVV